jgi:hypothetical protein
LVFLTIWCGPPIVVATSWTALCMSQGLADGVGSLRAAIRPVSGANRK